MEGTHAHYRDTAIHNAHIEQNYSTAALPQRKKSTKARVMVQQGLEVGVWQGQGLRQGLGVRKGKGA